QARAGVTLSSRTLRMMEDIEALSQVRPGEQGAALLSKFFDNNRSAAAFEGTVWANRHPALAYPAQAAPPRVFSTRGARRNIQLPSPSLQRTGRSESGWGDRIVDGWNSLRWSVSRLFAPYPIRWDHGNYYGEFPGYEWRQGYGYIPEQVFTKAFSGEYRFVPNRRGGGTIERISGR
ncbi:MAG: hypothetical protein AAB578_06995, partial [Elusimicrobiota bacterium]